MPIRSTDPAVDKLFEELRSVIAIERALRPANGGQAAPWFGTLDATLDQAEFFARAGDSLPPFDHLGPLRRLVAGAVGRLALYFMRLVTIDQQRFNGLALRALRGLQARDRELHRDLHELPDQLAGILRERDLRLDRHETELAERDRHLQSHQTLLAGHQRHLENLGSRIDALEQAGRTRDERLQALDAGLAERARSMSELAVTLHNLRARATVMNAQFESLRRRAAVETGASRGAPPVQPPAGEAPAADASALQSAAPDDPLLGTLVAAEALRGSEAEIGARQETYVRHFTGQKDVLDIGCGRGEFLELLRAAGIAARGVDADLDMVLRCHEKGLDVTRADALAYLAGLPGQSLGGIFCAQVVEHWRPPALATLVREAGRLLTPGAPLLIETLNPESLLVLYRWFWLDFTHERLVHPEALLCLLRSAGFAEVERLEMAAPTAPLRIPPLPIEGVRSEAVDRFDAATQYLNELLYAPYDYAVIARR
jgi:SAM-dependent methyltransferase